MEENGKAYKSPRRKLVQFFENSRDRWKTKCQVTKRLAKRLKNRVRFLETSKEEWRKRANALEERLTEERAREKAKAEEIEQLKKNLRSKRSSQKL